MDMESIVFKTKSIYWKPNHFNNILLQNNNGPCFLISLINSLILSHELRSGDAGDTDGWTTVQRRRTGVVEETPQDTVPDNETRAAITNEMLVPLKTLLSNSEVRLTDLLGELTSLLLALNTSANGQEWDLTPILNKLPEFHEGLDVNPSFECGILDTDKNPILKICDLLQLKVVHGWLLDDVERIGVFKDIETYEQLQDLQLQTLGKVQEYDTDKVLENFNLQDEEQLQLAFEQCGEIGDNPELSAELGNLRAINGFLSEHATQLTPYGLSALQTTDKIISTGEVAIFFRNQHFNTIYKTEDDRLVILLIDEGFRNSSQKSYDKSLVWETLQSVNGSSDLLLDGDFNPVTPPKAHAHVVSDTAEDQTEAERVDYGDYVLNDDNDVQHTADEMLAMSLQQTEDETYAKQLQSHYDSRQQPPAKKPNASGKKSKKKQTKPPANPSGVQTPDPQHAKDKGSCTIM